MINYSASAPAKIILFGEHAVVYGQPAVAIPISDVRANAQIECNESITATTLNLADLNIQFTINSGQPPQQAEPFLRAIDLVADLAGSQAPSNYWQLTLQSQIPIARGMGSSAATSVAVIRVLSQLYKVILSQGQLLELAFELEKWHHGTPSGIDTTVATLEKPIIFQRDHAIKTIQAQQFHFVIGDTGIAKKTATIVADVASKFRQDQQHYSKLFHTIGNIAKQGVRALIHKNTAKLGHLLNLNQELLEELGVSSPELDHLINIACENGAIGAKLCGAGQGGCMVALVASATEAENLQKVLKQSGAVNSYITELNLKG
jgi:mevalonate kinase